MLTAIFTFVNALINIIFGFVEKVLEFAFSLPLWLIILTNITNILGAIAIIGVIVFVVKKSNSKREDNHNENA